VTPGENSTVAVIVFYALATADQQARCFFKLMDAKSGERLVGLESVSKPALCGHSGGATFMAVYQNVAENIPRLSLVRTRRVLL
jgi:hypothetical protein